MREDINVKGADIELDFWLSYVYTLRLIGPISYPGECDLMVHPRKYSVIFSRMHYVTVVRI